MKSVVLALASNERYFPALYCAVASALSHTARERNVDLYVLDGGISQNSKDVLSRLVERFKNSVRPEFISIDPSIFHGATVGPGGAYMSYCRILLPRVLDVPRLIYLDCDVLVFRDLSELFDLKLPSGKILAAVRDFEMRSLGDDSRIVADALKVPAQSPYFNCGVILMNLEELRKQNFLERSVEFLERWTGRYRFHDQSAINFLLHGAIEALPGYWNRPFWQFDQQNDNDLRCVLHYTRSAPWLRDTPGPAQALFEQFAWHAGLVVNRRTTEFKRSQRQWLWRNALAPIRAGAFHIASILYTIAGRRNKAADYKKVGWYWFNYVRNAPSRWRIYRWRIAEIEKMKLDVAPADTQSRNDVPVERA